MTPLRDAAENATAGVPVVRKLEWRDLRPHAFPDMWCATSACGVYDIEEHSASDSPVYVALGPHYAFIADMDSLEEAKAACQADFEQRILSALNPDYISALDTARAEIERLRGERDELEAWFEGLSPNEMHAAIVRDKSALTAAQARIAELEGSAREVERLLDLLASKRSRATYLSMIDNDGCSEALLALDAARAAARTLSPAISDEAVDWQRAAMDETVRQITSMLTWGDVPLSRADTTLVEHIKGMPERMTEDFSSAKIGRWLGWAQGVACAKGWLHLDDCKRINKTVSDARAALEAGKENDRAGA